MHRVSCGLACIAGLVVLQLNICLTDLTALVPQLDACVHMCGTHGMAWHRRAWHGIICDRQRYA
jgi:hypothetical protein